MLAYFRHRQILTQLSKVEMMYLKQLALIGRVSQSTIRRDLKYLEKQGLVTVLNGGGVILNRVNYDYTIKAKINMHVEAKKVIAKYAATLIDDGDCIYLDSGTTVGMMIEFISQKNLSIFTTNVNIIDKLVSKDCECTIIGGYVKKAQGAMVGTITETVMSNLFFDRAFIGVSGISDENGASTPDMREVKKKCLLSKNQANIIY